ncbi:hypothetical protein BX264_5414 [Streptomyces sp. 2333.5]|nr:hypothetical protein BX264_5414 [Streptomyces sp. 2333.5]SEE65363.1 hypothetical protein SAMN05428943_5522 [Streptomyces sp. 2314.4]SEE91892.1 hypothetical protein SAMN05428942_5517 [Streptomyces sp. 2112.2]
MQKRLKQPAMLIGLGALRSHMPTIILGSHRAEFVGDSAEPGFQVAPLVLGQLSGQVDTYGELGAVLLSALRPSRKHKPRPTCTEGLGRF